MSEAGLVDELCSIVGRDHVLTDRELTEAYERDWTGRFGSRALAVVRPASTAQVASVLRLCNRRRIPVVAQGGNTGLVGGGVPRGRDVLLSLRRLSRVEVVDAVQQTAVVQAGATLSQLQEQVAVHGLTLGVDIASRGSATIGGMVATNAGGLYMLRHGPMRRQLLSVEAVTAGGQVVGRVPGLTKDNTGYDLASILSGSEGTLAVITRVHLRLVKLMRYRAVALLAFTDLRGALGAAAACKRDLPTVQAIECFFAEGLELVCRHAGLRPPFEEPAGAYLLVECAAHTPVDVPLAAFCERLQGLIDARVVSDPRDRAALWAYRERHTEAIGMEGVPHKLDISLPQEHLSSFPEAVRRVLAAFPGVRAVMFGHVADGNLHVNILGARPDAYTVDEAVFRLVAQMGGSISAEHGIGVAKARYLRLTRTPSEIALMRAVKAAFDPRGILNPGVILEA